ncbi:hypothetical protein [Desulfonema magnum]|uniref:Uncharacterized protein n=1 Tax=Desulfonema magnum TaxID=45655 RepID=A0A975GRX2_9BACT|nr:hypothetical protein [Desulfonema magnum]QTA91395.1 Uncharacterized protein dnm_074620 [Desulfonema magnum]
MGELRELLARAFDFKTFPKKPRVPVSELLVKQFDTWEPERLFEPDQGEAETFSAPPFVSDEKDAGELRDLLARVFDFKTFPKKPRIPVSELLVKQFDTWEPERLFEPDQGEAETFSAPPFVSDEKDAGELRDLLARVFDFKTFPKKQRIPVSELLVKQFDTWEPERLFEPDQGEAETFSAPPFVSDEKDAGELRGLLARVFDFKTFPKKPRVPVSELLAKQFDAWEPGCLFEPDQGEAETFSAPPFVSDEKDAGELRELLARVFDFKTFPKKPRIPVSELLVKQFDAWEPGRLFEPDQGEAETFSAPPFVSDEKDAGELRGLLARVFDFKTFPKKPRVPVSELLMKQFDAWEPERLFEPDQGEAETFSAPPFVSDEKDAGELRDLLARVFDFKDFPEKAEEPEAEKTPEAPAVPEKEPEKAEESEAEKTPEAPAVPEKEPEKAEESEAEKTPEAPAVPEKEPEKAEEPEAEKAPEQEPEAPKAEPEKPSELVKEEIKPDKTADESKETAKEAVKPAEIRKATPEQYRPPVKNQGTPPKVDETHDELPAPKKGSDPMQKTVKISIACVVFVFAIIIGTSVSNVRKYYIETTDEAVEIWQGWFAPLGEEMIVSLPGVQAPETVKSVYAKEEVYPLAFNYFIQKADTLLEAPGTLDFAKINFYLNKAISFGTPENVNKAYERLKTIDLLILMNKADIAASKGTLAGFEAALKHLNKAALLVEKIVSPKVKDNQVEYVSNKIELVKSLMAKLKAKETEKSAEESETDQKTSAPDSETVQEKSAPDSETVQPDSVKKVEESAEKSEAAQDD